MHLSTRASGPLRGTVRVPGDKSITHRALLLSAMAEGESRITGANPGADCAALARALRELGADIDRVGTWPGARADGDPSEPRPGYHVRGVGGAWREPELVLDLGNSGTALRLLAGAVATRDVFCVLDGDASLRRRPMARVSMPLRAMGARVDGPCDGARPPLVVRGGGLRGIRHESPEASAQVKSALLLAGMAAEGETWVGEPRRSRDHTERMLPLFGAEVSMSEAAERTWTSVRGGQRLRGAELEVPGDFSAAAFWLVAALVVPGSEITVEEVSLNPTRTGLLPVLERMGASLVVTHTAERSGDPTASVRARHARLHATDVTGAELPALVDEIPIWAVAAAVAEGVSTLSGAGELRHKESDRLRGIAAGLSALGVRVEERSDGLTVHGVGEAPPGSGSAAAPLAGGRLSSRGDHRLAMAFLIAGLLARDHVQVSRCEMVDTSYPGFYSSLLALVSSR